MKITKVYHVVYKASGDQALLFMPKAEQVSAIWRGADDEYVYKLVADVATDDLEHAWQLTNSIDHHWSQNDGVTAHAQRARSTSVGDVMVDFEGRVWTAASFGFELVMGVGACEGEKS